MQLIKRSNNRIKYLIVIFIILALISIALYLAGWILSQEQSISVSAFWKIVTKYKINNIVVMIIAAILISLVSAVFQTLTNNKILTPSLLGFDSIFASTQIFIMYVGSSTSIYITNSYLNFLVCTVVMVAISLLLYAMILRGNKNNVMLLLLAGTIITTLLNSLNNFLKVIMSPEDFTNITSLTMTSLSSLNTNIIYIAIPIMIILVCLFFRERRIYDVMILGEDQAVSLGVDYNKSTNRNLIYISIAMAISTALIGPISFLGLITVNATRQLCKNFRHKYLFIVSSLLGIIVIIFGQFMVEYFGYTVTLTTIINLIGGLYVVILILKENRI